MLEEKEWIDPALDGAGGGYGKYPGKTVKELSQLFRDMSGDPSMRSIKGMLRIAYEQLEGRSHLAVSVQASIVLGIVTLAIAATLPFFDGETRLKIAKAGAFAAVLFIGFFIGAMTSRSDAKAAAAQEKAILQLALAALEQVASHPQFTPGPLDSLQTQTLTRILKKSPTPPPPLQSLLTPPKT